jgi:hypothetical protein
MILSRTLRRFAAYAAVFGIALQALLPAIVQAAPKDSISVPVCSADGTRHEIQLPLGDQQSDKGAEHCKLCIVGADKAALTNTIPAAVVSKDVAEGHQEAKAGFLQSPFRLAAHPRAPPVLS